LGLGERIPADHPLRKTWKIVNNALASIDTEFDALYKKEAQRRRPVAGWYSGVDSAPIRTEHLPL